MRKVVAMLEGLNNLFSSEETSDNSDKIWDYLCKNPDAIKCLFLAQRNLLHMAVLKKKTRLVKKLLDQHPELIQQRDITQQVVLHHAMVSYDETILAMLLDAAPELIDAQRNDGRTPLHLALYSHIEPAIQQLIRAKANIYIRDNSGATPYLLAKETLTLFKLVCAWGCMINKPKKINDLGVQSTQTIDELVNKFSQLKINPSAQSLDIPSVYEATRELTHYPKNTSSSVSLNDVVTGNMTKLQLYLEQGGDPNAKHILGRSLLLCLFIKASSSAEQQECERAEHEKKFVYLAKYALLSQTDRSGRCIFDYLDHQALGKVRLLKQAYAELRAGFSGLKLHYAQVVKSMGEEFENILLFAGLQKLYLANKRNPTGLDANVMSADPRKIIDELCSGITPYNQERTFNSEYVSNMAWGLLSALTAHDIVGHLRNQWPTYSLEQKLIANYLVKEIMAIDFVTDRHQIIESDIEFMLKDNHKSFPLHAPKMNAYSENIYQYRNMLLNHPIYLNYKIISKWQQLCVPFENKPSFYKLIKETVSLPRKQRKPMIKQIAAEFITLSADKFSAIQHEEFYNKAWSKENPQLMSPNIMASIQVTNNLVCLVQEIIVNAKDIHEAAHLYEIFVRVASELCCSENSNGPDMGSVFIIMGALNSSDINRLRKQFDDFDKSVERKIDLLNKLIQPNRNYFWLRKMELAHIVAIPYLGKMLTDITFIYDGNDNWSSVCELLGIKFKNLIQQQSSILLVPLVPSTDLSHLLTSGDLLSEEKIYELSTKLVPPEITIESYTLSQLLFTMEKYINEKVLPNVNSNGKCFKGQHIVGAVFDQLKKKLLNEKASESFNDNFIKSRKLIGDLILLVNTKHPEVTINYLNYAFQLHEIRAEATALPNLVEQANPIIYANIPKDNQEPDKKDKKLSFRNSMRL